MKIGELKSVFSPVRHENLRALLRYSAESFGEDDAFIIKQKTGKNVCYTHISFAEFYDRVSLLGTAMMLRGMQGKRIAIIGKNQEEWLESYFAVLGGLGICVPLDKGLPYEELETSLVRSAAEVLIFDTEHLAAVEQLRAAQTTKVSTFICMDASADYVSVAQLRSEAKQAGEAELARYQALPIDAKALALIIFTSGTTSMAKAVMLSQYNIVENVYALHQHVELVLRHDLAVFTGSLVHAFNGGVYPWLWIFCQLVWMHVADVGLVWQISQSLLIGSDVVRQLFEVLGTRIDNLLGGLGGTVFHYHVWCMGKDIACAFNYTVHCSHASHSL